MPVSPVRTPPRQRHIRLGLLATAGAMLLLSGCDCATFEEDGMCPPQAHAGLIVPLLFLSGTTWAISSN